MKKWVNLIISLLAILMITACGAPEENTEAPNEEAPAEESQSEGTPAEEDDQAGLTEEESPSEEGQSASETETDFSDFLTRIENDGIVGSCETPLDGAVKKAAFIEERGEPTERNSLGGSEELVYEADMCSYTFSIHDDTMTTITWVPQGATKTDVTDALGEKEVERSETTGQNFMLYTTTDHLVYVYLTEDEEKVDSIFVKIMMDEERSQYTPDTA
ncbi:hypothetical protein G4V62_17940 [Bacillaceae bacterium SIJ1]|uniref:hypothetical protein n=1 Tax=Litoribacterium kuwaitense TaxID=1398745 RepID=UPI0013EB65EA|nr:hypothetical protein [Litoribacterium kuwaitense]NGP46734.1 hypothetical protein [Litoribacterium kuwaitense]